MRTDFDFPASYLIRPVVFRVLGQQTELGRFFTNTLIAIGTAGVLWGASARELCLKNLGNRVFQKIRLHES